MFRVERYELCVTIVINIRYLFFSNINLVSELINL
jgi:hypothetical protein